MSVFLAQHESTAVLYIPSRHCAGCTANVSLKPGYVTPSEDPSA